MSDAPSSAPTILPPGDAEAFDRDGFLVFDPGIDEGVLDAARSDATAMIGHVPGEMARYGNANPRVIDAWRRSESVRGIALAPGVLGVLRQIYGRAPKPFQTLNFPVGTEQPIHSDTIHFNSDPPGFMCGVWVALEDVDETNGPLRYYPGSHRLPELTMMDAEQRGFLARSLRERTIMKLAELGAPIRKRKWFRSDDVIYPAYERMIADEIERRGLVPEVATMRKGQAILWAANLLHGGAPQLDRSRTRHSQVTHYVFEGVEAYTPLRSFDSYRFVRTPEWIV